MRVRLVFILLTALFLAGSAVPATAQLDVDDTPLEEGEALEEQVGYGYSAKTGGLAIAADTSAVFCPGAGTVIVHPEDEDQAAADLKATVVDDLTWEIPDQSTGEVVVATVQRASAIFEDHVAIPNRCLIASALPKIALRDTVVALPAWPYCQRIRRCYQCGNLGNCGPAGCLAGYYSYSQVRNHLVCRFTNNWRDRCLEFLSPVCRLNRHKCRNCTEGIVQTWTNNRWVCAVF